MIWTQIDTREDPDQPRYEGDPADLIDAAGLLIALADRPAWHQQAACRGQGIDLFFPGRGVAVGPARAVCATCPVSDSCRAAGMGEAHGIWGGTSERERRRIRRSIALDAA